jgi:hypothetical protein
VSEFQLGTKTFGRCSCENGCPGGGKVPSGWPGQEPFNGPNSLASRCITLADSGRTFPREWVTVNDQMLCCSCEWSEHSSRRWRIWRSGALSTACGVRFGVSRSGVLRRTSRTLTRMEGRRSGPRHLKGFGQERPLAAVSSPSAIKGIVPLWRMGSTAMQPEPIGTAMSTIINSCTRSLGRPITIRRS